MTFPLKIKWCSELTWPVDHPPKIQNDTVYVRAEDRLSGSKFYALEARTGHVLWEYDAHLSDGIYSYRWEVTDHSVVVGRDDELYGLDRLTGQLIWRKAIDNQILRAMATDESSLYVTFSPTAYAIDPKSGETLWEWAGLPSHLTFLTFYDAYHSTLVVPANHFDVLAAKSGHVVYQSKEEPTNVNLGAVPYQDKLIYGDAVVDITTGKVEYELDNGDDSFTPAVISDTVYYLTREEQIAAWDLTKHRMNWKYSAGANRRFISNFAILGSYGYILADDDTLRAVSLANGKEVAQWSSPKSSYTFRDNLLDIIPFPALVATNNTLYLSVGTNVLYALEEH